jgi:hypothetical protein
MICGDKYITQRLYSRKGQTLKSPNANRYIPVDILWSSEELSYLKLYLTERKKITRDNKQPLFDERELEEAFHLITELLMTITGDPNIGFHVLRHSFCNWVVLLLSSADNFGRLNILCPIYFNHERLKALKTRMGLGDSSTRKLLYSASEMLGHGGVNTTLKHYFHLTEVFWLLHKNSYCPSIVTFTKKLFSYATNIDITYPLTIKNNILLTSALSTFCTYTCSKASVNNKELRFIVEKYSKSSSLITTDDISMVNLWDMFDLQDKNLNVLEIANQRDIPIKKINKVFDLSRTISLKYPTESKNKLPENP